MWGGGKNPDFYFLCDDPDLEREILTRINFYDGNVKFIRSNKSKIKKYVKMAAEPIWQKPGYAHLTVFYHAKRNGIKKFWNIDADDTLFLYPPEKIAECLKIAEKTAEENNIFCFSYDMHTSRYLGKHWTFGVTYTIMNTDIFAVMDNIKDNSWKQNYKKIVVSSNVDNFFTYIRDSKKAQIKSFNINNLYFIHFGLWGIGNGYRCIQVAKDGKLYFPLAENILNNNEFEIIDIDKDCINFDADIDINQSLSYMDKIFFGYVRFNLKNIMSIDENKCSSGVSS